MLRQGHDHFRGRKRENRGRNDLYTGENPNIDAISRKKDVSKDDSKDAPCHDNYKPDALK